EYLTKNDHKDHMEGKSKMHNSRIAWKIKIKCTCGKCISLVTYMVHKQGKSPEHNRLLKKKKLENVIIVHNIVLDTDEKTVKAEPKKKKKKTIKTKKSKKVIVKRGRKKIDTDKIIVEAGKIDLVW